MKKLFLILSVVMLLSGSALMAEGDLTPSSINTAPAQDTLPSAQIDTLPPGYVDTVGRMLYKEMPIVRPINHVRL